MRMSYVKGIYYAFMIALLLPQQLSANQIIKWGTGVDAQDELVSVYVMFKEVPDFNTVDIYGRQANSFQFYIDIDGATSDIAPDEFEFIIRGGEINIDGDIRIRENCAYSTCKEYSEPFSGGWGPIINTVPFTLDSSIVSFSIPWSNFSDDGIFTYNLLYTEYGQSKGPICQDAGDDINCPLYMPQMSGVNHDYPVATIPIPATAWLFGSGLTGLVGMARRKKKA